MSKHKLFLLTILYFVFGLPKLKAQETIPISGGNIAGNEGNVFYTIGYMEYKTEPGSHGSIENSMYQPFEISVIYGVNNEEVNFNLTASPNPTGDFLILMAEYNFSEKVSYRIYNINNKLVSTGWLMSNETSIDVRNLSPATYILTVASENSILKKFKVIKY